MPVYTASRPGPKQKTEQADLQETQGRRKLKRAQGKKWASANHGITLGLFLT